MTVRDKTRVVFGRVGAFPDKLSDEVLCAKDLLADFPHIRDFMIADADKDHAVVAEQACRQLQPRIDHRTPVRVEAAVGIGISEQPVLFFVKHTHLAVFFVLRPPEIVGVNEVVPGIVQRGKMYSTLYYENRDTNGYDENEPGLFIYDSII